MFVGVLDGSSVGVGEGGSPSIVKLPETTQVSPLNICSSYSTGIHIPSSGSQIATPYPPVLPFQGNVS